MSENYINSNLRKELEIIEDEKTKNLCDNIFNSIQNNKSEDMIKSMIMREINSIINDEKEKL